MRAVQTLLQPAKRSKRAMYVVQAQLALLLRLAGSGADATTRGDQEVNGSRHQALQPRQSMAQQQQQQRAQRMHSINAIQMLDSCRAIDMEPEEPHRYGWGGWGEKPVAAIKQRLRQDTDSQPA